MNIRQKGRQYEISYRCPNYSKPIYERFPSYEAAKLRVAQIEYEKSIGQLRPPKVTPSVRNKPLVKDFLTIGDLMDEYVQLYGLNHWGDSYLSCSRHRIDDYIKPYLGNVLVQDLTTHDLDLYYDSLRDKPAVVLKGHKSAGKTVSPQVIEKVHALLRSALNQAVTWGYIKQNPALNATLPQYEKIHARYGPSVKRKTLSSFVTTPFCALPCCLLSAAPCVSAKFSAWYGKMSTTLRKAYKTELPASSSTVS